MMSKNQCPPYSRGEHPPTQQRFTQERRPDNRTALENDIQTQGKRRPKQKTNVAIVPLYSHLLHKRAS